MFSFLDVCCHASQDQVCARKWQGGVCANIVVVRVCILRIINSKVWLIVQFKTVWCDLMVWVDTAVPRFFYNIGCVDCHRSTLPSMADCLLKTPLFAFDGGGGSLRDSPIISVFDLAQLRNDTMVDSPHLLASTIFIPRKIPEKSQCPRGRVRA